MPDYDFRSLSPTDFEHLSRDVLNADLGLRLHSYPAGRDQGIDLRQADANGQTIVGQCKHYLESSASAFLAAVAKEGKRGKTLKVDRYLFVTSRPVTSHQQDEILIKLKGLPVVKDDIWGREALNAALGRNPEVERRHIKLWISSTEVLDALINSGRWQRSKALLAELAVRTRLWVHTSAYDAVLDMLENDGVCLLTGPPGVGKTFLAEMVLLAAAQVGWQTVHVVDNIEGAWQALQDDDSLQIFYYDDFLGREPQIVTSKSEASSLNSFITRVRQLKRSKRLIMTTPERYLNEAADGASNQLADLARLPMRFSLRLEAYDIDTRAEILFNRLYFSDLPPKERDRLAIDNRLISIVQHPSYSPRLVDVGVRFSPTPTADDVVTTIGRFFDNPANVWQESFRLSSPLERQILLTLASLPYRPWSVDLIRQLAAPTDALAWTPALHTLEATWLEISGAAADRLIALANPGCRGYLLGVLDDTAVALDQLDRVRLLPQLVSLVESAGLSEPLNRPGSTPARAELAGALTGQRDQVLTLLESLTQSAIVSAPASASRLRTLYDAATVLQALGTAERTAWFLDLVAEFNQVEDKQPSALPIVGSFSLAELIDQLKSDDLDKQHLLARTLALTALKRVSTFHDLDAFEALPEELRLTPDLQAAAQERARAVIGFEYSQLLDAQLDVDEIETAAQDLAQRAQYYGVPLEIGPLLDHADNLRQEASELPDWPAGEVDDDADDMDLHQVFAQLGTDELAH